MVDALHLGIGSLPLTLWSRSTHGRPVSVRNCYITILVIPVIVFAIVLLPFIAFVLYTWWSQRRGRI